MVRQRSLFLVVSLYLGMVRRIHAFQPPQPRAMHRRAVSREMGLFDGLIKAFDNDEQFQQEKRATTKMVSPTALKDTQWNVVLCLTGIPSSDPSSDLFGPRRRITDGEPVGEQLELSVALCGENSATISASPFTGPAPITGSWRIEQQQYSGAELALSFDCQGFTRTIVTKGSLTSVFGGDETALTSSSYNIPAGICMLRTEIKVSELGSVRLSEGTLFSPVKTGWQSSWKKAGAFTAKPEKQASPSPLM